MELRLRVRKFEGGIVSSLHVNSLRAPVLRSTYFDVVSCSVACVESMLRAPVLCSRYSNVFHAVLRSESSGVMRVEEGPLVG